ncbi:hypothetical protein LTR27_005573 [Elasticomyces elasticus]|nr:hypothetical protein LTR27_005573 [Elasticomyces elasticus]
MESPPPPPPSPSPPSRGTKRSASGEPLIGKNRISSLYKPEMVSIFVYEEEDEEDEETSAKDRELIEYQVPRGLIRASSEYFDKAFGDQFEEGQSGRIVLDEVQPWVFECFIGWLYTQKVFWEHQSVGKYGDSTRAQPKADDDFLHPIEDPALTEAALLDPVNWKWYPLFTLYIFADMYETRRLRIAVMEAIQCKTFQRKPVEYPLASLRDCSVVLGMLPDSSPLYKFLLDHATYDAHPGALTEAWKYDDFPPSVLVELMMKALQLSRCAMCERCSQNEACDNESHADIKSVDAPYKASLCRYHEHQSEREEELCRQKWLQIDRERGIYG